MNNFTQRTLSAGVYVGLIATCLLSGTWPAFALFFLFTVLSLWEYKTMLLEELTLLQKVLFMLFGAYLFTMMCLWQFSYIPRFYYGIALLVTVSTFVIELFHKNLKPFDSIGRQITGWVYIPVSLALLYGLGFQKFLYEDGQIAYNGKLVLSVFILIWANDTFAYLTGRWLGKRPLFSRISPKKTIEGTLGGLLFTALSAIALLQLFHQLTLVQYIILALLVSITATVGDLIESMLKRSLDLKDSGNLIPGHGGILDRLDATLITAWFVYFLFQIF